MHRANRTRRLSLILPALTLLAVGATVVAKPEPVGLVGVVLSVAEDEKSFEFKAKKGPYAVTWNEKTRWEEHTVITLDDVKEGSILHVLGKVQEAQPTSAGGTYPPQFLKVQAIVSGIAYKPSVVSAELGTQSIRWTTGKVSRDGKQVRIEDTLLAVGGGREVLQVKETVAKVPEKKTQLFIAGLRDLSDRKNKTLAAKEILRIDPRWKEYELTHDLANRKPQAEEEFGF